MKHRLLLLTLALLLTLCLTLPVLAEEPITIQGIEDGVLVSETGYVSLIISGGREGMLYRGTLAFTKLNGKPIELYFDYYAGIEPFEYWEGIASQPGEYGPFTLSLALGDERVETEFMLRVPEDADIWVKDSWAPIYSDDQPVRSHAEIMPYDHSRTENIWLMEPRDRCVLITREGQPIRMTLEMAKAGTYTVEVRDVVRDEVVGGENLYTTRPDMWLPTIDAVLESGRLYQLSVSLKGAEGIEKAYIHFFAVDEAAWDGTNPWEALDALVVQTLRQTGDNTQPE